MSRVASLLVVVLSLVAPSRVYAQEVRPTRATFALIIGSNQSVDQDLVPLKYADDDAARYLDLFRLLGAKTYLLTRLDENTRRLHPQAVAEAEEPKRAPFDRAVTQLVEAVAQASARQVETVVYFVYAGHGNVANGQGYITLEDARITGAELAQIVKRIPATRVHVIVDACASYFLAYSRGPGGERRALEGFRASALTEDPRVGVLLSTSSARESHEWDGFQGGVFSHEVRSGLYGAADANGDGEVSYREMAAFVARANAAVPNEKYRPDVYARAPNGNETLLDIRQALRRRLIIEGNNFGHYIVEDARGVRVAEGHNAPGQTLSLVRPGPTIPIYLRRTDDDREYLVPPGPEVVALADLPEGDARTRARGAAHESFSLLFSLPFDGEAVAAYREPAPAVASPPAPDDVSSSRTRKTIGFSALGAGALGLGVGTILAISASSASSGSAGESQADAASRNDRISHLNTASAVSFVVGGVAAGTGIVLLLWPSASKNVQVSVTPLGAQFGYTASF